jgi:hypothetical protein
MKFKFETLLIWQKGMDLGENMNQIADLFPKKKFIIYLHKYEELQIQLL